MRISSNSNEVGREYPHAGGRLFISAVPVFRLVFIFSNAKFCKGGDHITVTLHSANHTLFCYLNFDNDSLPFQDGISLLSWNAFLL
jgi:hypothetical protein